MCNKTKIKNSLSIKVLLLPLVLGMLVYTSCETKKQEENAFL